MYEKRIVPLTDVYETDTLYSLTMEVPGIEKDDLEVTVENDQLLITSKVKEEAEVDQSELKLGNYYRNFTLSKDIDRSKVNAELNNGILTVTLFKKEESQPKKIEITVH